MKVHLYSVNITGVIWCHITNWQLEKLEHICYVILWYSIARASFLTETLQNVSINLHKYPKPLFTIVIQKGLVGTRLVIYEPVFHEYLCKWTDTFLIFKPFVKTYTLVSIFNIHEWYSLSFLWVKLLCNSFLWKITFCELQCGRIISDCKHFLHLYCFQEINSNIFCTYISQFLDLII